MTTVYGVTRYGARLQIEGQLQDIEDFPKDKVFDASLYLTQKTFYCLQKMFTSTKEIQVCNYFCIRKGLGRRRSSCWNVNHLYDTSIALVVASFKTYFA